MNSQENMPPLEASNMIPIGLQKSNLDEAQNKELKGRNYEYVQGQ